MRIRVLGKWYYKEEDNGEKNMSVIRKDTKKWRKGGRNSKKEKMGTEQKQNREKIIK